MFLTGAPFVVSSFAKITKKPGPFDKEVEVITIEKGDTLWHLAGKYLDAPYKWPEFKKYNNFTNPDLIYPDEEMQIPLKVAKVMAKDWEKEVAKIEAEIKAAIQNSNQDISSKLQSQMAEVRALKEAVEELRRKIDQVENLEKKITNLDDRLSKSESEIKSEFEKSTRRVNQLDEKVDGIDQNVKALDGKVDKLAVDGQQQITGINQGVETLTTKVSQNQESISRLEKKFDDLEGKVEQPSRGKKAFVVLTTLAGGIAWFVVSSLSHSD
jgi:predicted RNase H-like nuclease (RuvC/YqgF family)